MLAPEDAEPLRLRLIGPADAAGFEAARLTAPGRRVHGPRARGRGRGRRPDRPGDARPVRLPPSGPRRGGRPRAPRRGRAGRPSPEAGQGTGRRPPLGAGVGPIGEAESSQSIRPRI